MVRERSVTVSDGQWRSVTVSDGQWRSVTVSDGKWQSVSDGQWRSVMVSDSQWRSVTFSDIQSWRSVMVSDGQWWSVTVSDDQCRSVIRPLLQFPIPQNVHFIQQSLCFLFVGMQPLSRSEAPKNQYFWTNIITICNNGALTEIFYITLAKV